MIKSKFYYEPVSLLEMAENERYLYVEICELKRKIKKNRKENKRKFNQLYGETVKKQKDYIPMSRLDLMRKELIEKGRNSTDLEEKKKIQYALGILYQLNFYIKGE